MLGWKYTLLLDLQQWQIVHHMHKLVTGWRLHHNTTRRQVHGELGTHQLMGVETLALAQPVAKQDVGNLRHEETRFDKLLFDGAQQTSKPW